METVKTKFNKIVEHIDSTITDFVGTNLDPRYVATTCNSEAEYISDLNRIVCQTNEIEDLTDGQYAAFEEARIKFVPFYLKFKAYDRLNTNNARFADILSKNEAIVKGLAGLSTLQAVDERLKDVDLGMLKFRRKKHYSSFYHTLTIVQAHLLNGLKNNRKVAVRIWKVILIC